MNRLLLTAEELAGGDATIVGARALHLIRVLGVRRDSQLRAGIIDGVEGMAKVAEVGEASVVVTFEATGLARPPLPVDLVVALPRPKVLRRVLQHAAAWHVRSVALVNSWRVDKSYWGSPLLAPEALRAELVVGAEQGGAKPENQ